MKKIVACLLVCASLSAFAQDKKNNGSGDPQSAPVRTASTSAKASASPAPYDVNDKYMGRKAEFLNNLTVSELPADFPVYQKKWGVKEYNEVVDAYYRSHLSILKDQVKQKLTQK